LGAGPENLKEALKQTKNKRAIEYGVLTGHTVDKAHNDFLHIAAVSGTPALLFYIFFIFSLLVKQRKNIFNCSVQSTIALTVFAYLIQSLFNISVIAVAPLFWVLLGLLANKNQQVST
jgi:putative inorganic carbon (HCO3(-)) transporter